MQPEKPKAMQPRAEAPPGLETDGEGNVIPLEKRTPEDRAASVKNPEHEAETPAPMPRDQQGQGGSPRQNDPAGQQGEARKTKGPVDLS